MDHNPQPRRPHYQRGRRGSDRRGGERRVVPQSPDQPARTQGDVDVEQIMRDIRARIAQRHGIELSAQQIQELAARRLEAILDPRNINPTLMEQLRKGAGTPAALPPAQPDPGYTFDDTTLFESHRGLVRVIRRLLNPLLKLFFNPAPIAQAFHTQARLNREAAAREAERERQQAEWNALHYEVLQRLVAEVARGSLELQSLALRVESLSARVDFNDKRVRAMEAAPPPGRAPSRPAEAAQAPPAAAAGAAPAPDTAAPEAPSADGTRRRRRRRRGRRGSSSGDVTAGAAVTGQDDGVTGEGPDIDEGEDESADAFETSTTLAAPATGPVEPASEASVEPVAHDITTEQPHAIAADAVAEPIASSEPIARPEPLAGTSAPPPPVEQPTPPRDEPEASIPADDPDAGPPER